VVEQHTALLAGQESDPPEIRRRLAKMGLTLAEYFCDQGRETLLFQGQPFVVAETFTGVPGEYVSLEETVRGFGAIVDGRCDGVPEEAFRFIGTLSQAQKAAG
jgi:F0F1-type ATP synthase beta subunit